MNVNSEKSETMQIPAEKVGMVIGKGGEMIKLIQERTGASLKLIQDDVHAPEKPLIIQGGQEVIERAKKMVLDILNDSHVDGDHRQLRLEV